MPIISTIGRKQPKARLLIAGIYLLLIAGGVTMVYPFLLMLAGSTKSAVDVKELSILPSFLAGDAGLYRKHIEGLYNESVLALQIAYDMEISSFEKLEPPPEPRRALVEQWEHFLASNDLPIYSYSLGYVHSPVSRSMPLMLRHFKRELSQRYDGSIEQVNAALNSQFLNWNAVFLLPEQYLLRRELPPQSPYAMAFWEFKKQQPRAMLSYANVEGFYKTMFLKPQYTKDIKAYNTSHGTSYESYDAIRLPRRVPAVQPAALASADATPQLTPTHTQKERDDWENFVRSTLNLVWLRADPESAAPYRKFLAAKYGTIDAVNRNYSANYTSFDDIPPITGVPNPGISTSDWASLLEGWNDPDTGQMHLLPIELIRIESVEFLFRDFLQKRFESIDRLNAAMGTAFTSFLDVQPPQRDLHYQAFANMSGSLRREFITRNFRTVLEHMLLHGRGIVNTVIYCTLAVVCALTFNPLAAYAMSRYKMPTTYKILLFLMLTMAFPAMVTQIPVFLMLRNLGLLNTFAALILPGLASGYSIFLLKGFFDSLPQELYESASLDGAGEWRIFWTITMSLSKPILAVIALGAFTGAYSNFMFALLICQDQKMWTLMVWLYQLQMRSGPGVIFASLIIAAIPTLLIFIFCQNIIMRGIVVPVEK